MAFEALVLLGRLLVRTQTVTKLCGFEKRAGLPYLEHTDGYPSPSPVESLGQLHPAEISHTRGPECCIELGFLEHVSREAFV